MQTAAWEYNYYDQIIILLAHHVTSVIMIIGLFWPILVITSIQKAMIY